MNNNNNNNVLYKVAVVVAAIVLSVGPMAEAVTCNLNELRPCYTAVFYGTVPSRACCGKLKEQKPCFCGYIRDPKLRQYASSPHILKVAASCGVAYPKCLAIID